MEVMITTFEFQSAFRICEGLGNIYPKTGENRVDVLWKTMLAGGRGNQLPEPGDPKKIFFDWTAVMFMVCLLQRWDQKESDDDFQKDMIVLEKLGSNGAQPLLPTRDQINARANIWTETQQMHFKTDDERLKFALEDGGTPIFGRILAMNGGGRRLYRTAKGLFGLGPGSVKKDDEVWLIKGARVPFILRGCPGKKDHRLVGETYIHGYMNGEMLDAVSGKIVPVGLI
ncbi:uncharacterized protein K452DRAFT_300889 [Aplosporella prunicola CBS 121167]|uniref:Heterokaryon incompatibility domain-containing protein n=1 Tax=Aplosporella prunicola CBS 121167 TaxID=1176127 RepID=A0A6A6B6B9_9PEZI|nr:uncharacterized protein K452DRAFT_300889 [Aplosporella prunicola CBS 121167]KAF2138825.1 hypothetical protein K452DRAFT_300889 [Aplosporella prunicola CBS 121167]